MIKQILIVDDQIEVGKLIGNYLRQIGFIPVVVSSVDQALKNFDPKKYLMIISDVVMPGKNGFDLVRYMHNNHPQVPIALISGYFDDEMKNLQEVFGIERIYLKPVFFKTVKEIVANSLVKLGTKGA
jgi:DNA-binding NtrC family response regulator